MLLSKWGDARCTPDKLLTSGWRKRYRGLRMKTDLFRGIHTRACYGLSLRKAQDGRIIQPMARSTIAVFCWAPTVKHGGSHTGKYQETYTRCTFAMCGPVYGQYICSWGPV